MPEFAVLQEVPASKATKGKPTSPAISTYATVEPAKLLPNPWQPRTRRDEEADAALRESIAANGLLQRPVARLVAVAPGGRVYELAVGHRRAQAITDLMEAKDGRWRERGIPIEVRPLSDEQMAVLALTENVDRKDLGPVEIARAWARMLELEGMTQERVGQLVGKDRSTVANSIRMLALPEKVLDLVDAGVMPARTAMVLLQLDNGHRLAVEVLDCALEEAAEQEDYRSESVRDELHYCALRNGWKQLTDLSEWDRTVHFDVPAFVKAHPETIYTLDKAKWTSDKDAWALANKEAIQAEKAKAKEEEGHAGLVEEQGKDQVIKALAKEAGVEFDWRKPNLEVLKAAGTRGSPPVVAPYARNVPFSSFSRFVDRKDCGTCTNGATWMRPYGLHNSPELHCANMECYEEKRNDGAVAAGRAFQLEAERRDEEQRKAADAIQAALEGLPAEVLRPVVEAVVTSADFYDAAIADAGFSLSFREMELVRPLRPALVLELKQRLGVGESDVFYLNRMHRKRLNIAKADVDALDDAQLARVCAVAAAHLRLRANTWNGGR